MADIINDPKISQALSLLNESLKEKKDEIAKILEERYSNLYNFFTESIRKNIPPSAQRVEKFTSENAKHKIWLETVENIAAYVKAGKPEIDKRLNELEYEWDIEQAIEVNAASLSLAGLIFSLRCRYWLILPFTVSSFLLQHGIQGWCPPVSIFRNLGIRTRREIDDERNALKRIRGDFGPFQSHDKDPRNTAVSLLNMQNI